MDYRSAHVYNLRGLETRASSFFIIITVYHYDAKTRMKNHVTIVHENWTCGQGDVMLPTGGELLSNFCS